MKKFMPFVLCSIILVLGLSCTSFAAGNYTPPTAGWVNTYPVASAGATPTGVWLLAPDGTWQVSTASDGANYDDAAGYRPGQWAKAYNSGNGYVLHCNRFKWGEYKLTNHASIAQWFNFSLSSDRWDWEVRKWGTFIADCWALKIQSNGDIWVDFDDFSNLISTENSAYPSIPVLYAVTDGSTPNGSTTWYTPDQLNAMSLILNYNDIKNEVTMHVWNQIQVGRDTHACEYEDQGYVWFTLKEQKGWIDGDTGNWKARG